MMMDNVGNTYSIIKKIRYILLGRGFPTGNRNPDGDGDSPFEADGDRECISTSGPMTSLGALYWLI